MLPGIQGAMSGIAGVAAIVASFLTRTSDSGVTTEAEVTGYAIGDAAADRTIIVAIHWAEDGASHRTVTSVTIGGVAATIHLQSGHSGGSSGFGVCLASAIVPTGTTATITVNFSGTLGSQRVEISAIRVTGLANSSPHDTASDTTSGTANDLSATIDVPEGGLVIAAFSSSTLAANEAVGWSGVTEEYDASNFSIRVSLAWDDDMAAETGRTISVNVDPTANAGNAFVAVSWN